MNTIFLKNANIVDVEKQHVYYGNIYIKDGIIQDAAPNLIQPEDVQVIDLHGATVTPGLFNCHVHVTLMPEYEPEPHNDAQYTMMALDLLHQLIDSGVTYVRDVGAFDFIDVDLRDASRRGAIVAPDIYSCGKCICMTGGHSWQYTGCSVQVDGPDEARKAARTMLRAGTDGIKLIATGGVMTKGVEPSSPQLTIEEMRAACEEVHKVGGKACAHAQGTTGIKNAILAGIDSIEHGNFLDEETVMMMKEKNIYYVPTLSAIHWILAHPEKLPEYVVRKSQQAKEHLARSFRLAKDAGIKICMGTDSGTPSNKFYNSPFELVLMVEHGMTPMEAIIASTLNSAELCGVEQSLGSISSGKRAHLAVFQENPIEDIHAIMNCIMTIKDGRVLYRNYEIL